MPTLSDRLNHLIEKKKISKKYVAERLKVSPDLVSKWCSNNPNVRRDPSTQHLSELADLLEVSTDYLLCRTNVEYNRTEQEIINSLEMTEIDELIRKHGISIDDKRYTMSEMKAIIQALKSLNKLNL